MNLEKVAALVVESETAGAETLRLQELHRKHENWSRIAGLITFGLILVMLIAIVVAGMIWKGGLLILPGSFLILFALGAGVMGYFQTSAKLLKQKLEEPKLPPAAGTPDNRSLPPNRGSVTEGTTKLLREQSDRSTSEISN